MSGFHMTIKPRPGITPQRRAELQAIVDETCEPRPGLPGISDAEQAKVELESSGFPYDPAKDNL